MWLPLIGLAVGIALGLVLNVNVSPDLARYSAVAHPGRASTPCLARCGPSWMRTTTTASSSPASSPTPWWRSALTFVGDRLGIDLYLVALFAFGLRIFQNVALIRRHFL